MQRSDAAPAEFATPIHPALVRPILLAGAERAPGVLEAVVTGVLVLKLGVSLVSLLVACFALFVCHPLLVHAAKRDPQAVEILLKSLSLQSFYPALATYDAPTLPHPPFNSAL